MLLVLPLNWLSAAFFAALFHELCHIAGVYLCGCKIVGFHISFGGAAIETEPMDTGRTLLCTLAGPVGSFLLLSLHRYFPRLALCAGVQGLFNLLPVYPLDGGRILRCLLSLLWPEYAGKIAAGAEMVTFLLGAGVLAALILCGISGWLPIVFGAALILRGFPGKIPCKQARIRVQ